MKERTSFLSNTLFRHPDSLMRLIPYLTSLRSDILGFHCVSYCFGFNSLESISVSSCSWSGFVALYGSTATKVRSVSFSGIDLKTAIPG